MFVKNKYNMKIQFKKIGFQHINVKFRLETCSECSAGLPWLMTMCKAHYFVALHTLKLFTYSLEMFSGQELQT